MSRPATLFHGTNAALGVGAILIPGDALGETNWPGMDNGWGVWMTPYPDVAARYGEHVYEVRPVGAVTDWTEENDWPRERDNEEYVAERAEVVRIHA